VGQQMQALAANDAEPNGPHGIDANIPLAVDLDGTLVFTDMLFEALAEHMRRRPLWTIWQMIQLPFALAKVKAHIQGKARLDIEHLPVNEDVVAYCRRARADGRKVWLVSASDQGIVSEIADCVGVFDRAVGSDGTTNNKGANKGKFLEREAPQGFEYIGDSRADMPVWAKAKAASIVGGGETRKRAVERMGVPVAQTFERPSRGLGAWIKALRLHQWAKNALIFVPAIMAMKITDPSTLMTLLVALPLIGAMASGTYILNDLVDLSADRSHPSKHKRPFASGRLKLWQGFVAAPLLIIGGLVGGWLISPGFAVTMLSYLIVTLAYSFKLKRAALADAMTLSFLYTMRLVMGAVLAGVALSHWLMVFSMFLFVSLSLAKRHVEVIRRLGQGERRIANRGYRAEDSGLTLGLGVATATIAPLILVLYLIESAWPSGHYATPQALWVAPVMLALWLMRVWLLANRGQLDDDPVVFAIKDPQSLAMGFVLGLGFVAAVLLPPGSAQMLNLNELLGIHRGGPD
jgi:4-hydroxybenzoate polyprenyltransferase/phosphoserine phosphatase